MFTGKFAGYGCEELTCEVDGFIATAKLYVDDSSDAPWEREDGHGPVSDWQRGHKQPGQMKLAGDAWHGAARFYDYAEACRIARRDGWGVTPYRLDVERGANGLQRATAQWFAGRDLQTFTSDWYDAKSANDAIRDLYAAHRATFPSARAYAAAAAMADYERLRDWCNDNWRYVGVAVTVEREDVELGGASLWGIESDAGEYLTEVANELLDEALDAAREKIAALCGGAE